MKETWDEQTGAYRSRAEELGKQPFIVMLREAAVADTFEQAAKGLEEWVVPEMRLYFRKGIFTRHPDFRICTEERGCSRRPPNLNAAILNRNS